MKSPSKKLARPTVTPFEEDAAPGGGVRILVEVDAGTGRAVQVSIDLKISVHARKARATSHVTGALEPSSAELSDQRSTDDLGDGPYVVTLFGEKVPVSQLKIKRRRFGLRK